MHVPSHDSRFAAFDAEFPFCVVYVDLIDASSSTPFKMRFSTLYGARCAVSDWIKGYSRPVAIYNAQGELIEQYDAGLPDISAIIEANKIENYTLPDGWHITKV